MQLTFDISNTRYLELFGISKNVLVPWQTTKANNYAVSQILDISNSFLIPLRVRDIESQLYSQPPMKAADQMLTTEQLLSQVSVNFWNTFKFESSVSKMTGLQCNLTKKKDCTFSIFLRITTLKTCKGSFLHFDVVRKTAVLKASLNLRKFSSAEFSL